jgi:ABC-2 type transport system permease protein
MKSYLALIKREFLEHRAAFLYAPAAILSILALMLLSGISVGRFAAASDFGIVSGAKAFEFGFLILSALWFVYLLATLFFYFADAFSADTRNNSMLFWKSMPQSDFKMLASKMLAGTTLFPGLIFLALLLSAVIVFIGVVLVILFTSGLVFSTPMAFLSSAANVVYFDLVYLVLALLWYAPFFAWVGLLSTLFRRWSIPLSFLIPGLAMLGENLITVRSFNGPPGGYIISYLKQRIDFSISERDLAAALFTNDAFDAGYVLSHFVAGIDWVQLVGGLGVALLFVYLASEYRRRYVST